MENENKVITKDDERKALEQIKKIVESVGGEKSYIGTAFKGVFELAEQNIEYDAAFSAKWYIDEVTAYKEKTIAGEKFLLMAKCDWVKAGTIYDSKRVEHYEVGEVLRFAAAPDVFGSIRRSAGV